MSDLHLATAAHSTVSLAGRTYKIGPLTMKTLGQVQAWINDQTWTDPVEELKAMKDDLDPDLYRAEMADAWMRKRSGRELVMGGGYDLLSRSDAGRRVLFAAVLREHQPAASDTEIAEAYDDCTAADIVRLFTKALGVEDQAAAPDPKALAVANGVPSA